MTHPFPSDADFHPQDARRALRERRAVRVNNPWCQCPAHYGGIITCRVCGRMRGPARDKQAEFTQADFNKIKNHQTQ